MRALNIVITVL